MSPPPPSVQRGLLRLRDTRDPLDGVVPFYPIYPGLAVNTTFYAAAWWLILLGPGSLRRHFRLRRGLCPRCAYDLSATASRPCPECGWEPTRAEAVQYEPRMK